MSFGSNLQFFRDAAEMTQEELAERLTVSRQSVSKWESDICFPEMEKLLALCRLFHTDLDTLLRKDVHASVSQDTAGYNRHMNRFSTGSALGIGLMLFSVAGSMALYGYAGLSQRGLAIVLIVGIAIATSILTAAGIGHSRFEREHPIIQDFYSKEAREGFLKRYPLFIAASIAALFAGLLWLVILGQEAWQMSDREKLGQVAGFLAVTGIGVTGLVWTVLYGSKYDIAGWNRLHDPSPEAAAFRKRVGKACTVIMLIATAVYLALGFGAMATMGVNGGWGWQWGWAVYPVAGVLCALSAYLIPKPERDGM